MPPLVWDGQGQRYTSPYDDSFYAPGGFEAKRVQWSVLHTFYVPRLADFFSLVDKIPKQYAQQSDDLEQMEKMIDSRRMSPAITTISATNHISEQSFVTIGPSAVVARSRSSTTGLMPGSSGTPTENTPPPTLLHHPIDHASARSPIGNFTRRFVPRRWASEITQNDTSTQSSW